MEPEIQQPKRKNVVEAAKVMFKHGLLYLSAFAVLTLLVLGAGDRWIRRFSGPAKPVVHEVRVLPAVLYEQLDKDVLSTLARAEESALKFAEQELMAYFQELQTRTEGPFCEWYFSYVNQQMLIANYLVNLTRGKEYASEQLVVRIESEFANRVFSAQTAEMRFERLADDTVARYAEQVEAGLDGIALKYRIPQEAWGDYLASLGVIVSSINPTRSVPVGTKIAVAGATVATIVGGRVLGSLITTMVRKLTGRIAAETVEATAVRAGTVAAAEMAGRVLLPIVTAGLIAWEWYDHQRTVEEQTPVLLNCVHDFFAELKKKLLADLKSMLVELKEAVVKNMRAKS
jgi:hypothetical protein